MASDLASTNDVPYEGKSSDPTSGYAEVTVEISESGWADLSRLQLLAADRFKAALDLLPQTLVESIRIHNTHELIRGQGDHLGAPAGVFSPFRQYGPIQLGRWWLEAGNVVTIGLRTPSGLHATRRKKIKDDESRSPMVAYSAAFPFLPDNRREYRAVAELDRRCGAYVGGHAGEPEHDASTITFRFDQDGIVNLDSLQIAVDPKEPTAMARDDAYGVSTTVVESIELPTRQELVVGGNGRFLNHRAAPAGIFGSLGRRFSWVRFGLLEVSTDNVLTVRVRGACSADGAGAEPKRLSAGMQFYPRKRASRGART